MITDSERREFAAKMREHAEEETAFTGVRIAEMFGIDSLKDRACWNFLADLIEPDRIPDNSDKTGRDLSEGARDALLAVADGLGKIRHDYSRRGMEACAYFGREAGGCETCEASKSDDPCLEQAIDDVSRRIREAVDACEARPDAPVAVDEVQTATDAHEDEEGASAGYYEGYVHPVDDDDYAACCWVRENGGLGAVKARMMPEGMEWLVDAWPRFEDGKPVRIGDDYECWCGDTDVVISVTIRDGRSVLNKFQPHPFVVSDGPFTGHGKRVKRPAPKVYDADGTEVREGDEVWDTDGTRRKVRRLNENGTVEFEGHEDRGWFAKFFTHRAPVLAADGKPLEVGQTVWDVSNGIEFTVAGLPRSGEYQSVKLRLDDGAVTGLDPDRLTHQRPDSWERIEEDAKSLCHDIAMYLGDYSPSDFEKSGDSVQDRVIETVRRCRALAEREMGE